jgi:hypothetical protein
MYEQVITEYRLNEQWAELAWAASGTLADGLKLERSFRYSEKDFVLGRDRIKKRRRRLKENNFEA